MAIVRIEEAILHEPPPELEGWRLEGPRAGSESDVYALEVAGSVPPEAAITGIEVSRGNRVIAEVALTEPGNEFHTWIGALEVPTTFELVLRARLAEGGTTRLATIRGTREPLRTAAQPRLQPVMINSLGRTGTTWLTWLLGCHPEIVAFEPFSRETRVSTYWMTVLQRLGAPESYLSAIDPVDLVAPRWWLGEEGVDGRVAGDPEVGRWLGVERLRLLAGQCQEEIDHFYVEHSAAGARYFVEKVNPGQLVPDLLSEVYEGAREILLVRDFRDMYCSIRSYVASKDPTGFGWRPDMEADEYVRTVIRNLAATLAARWEARREGVLLIRYEDLVRKPDQMLGAVAEALGIDADAEMLRRTVKRASADAAERKGHLTSPDPETSIGRWRQELSPELKEVFASALSPMLEAFGYDPQPGGEV